MVVRVQNAREDSADAKNNRRKEHEAHQMGGQQLVFGGEPFCHGHSHNLLGKKRR
jgi:hypothetical protein